jgi:hypothetical protein
VCFVLFGFVVGAGPTCLADAITTHKANSGYSEDSGEDPSEDFFSRASGSTT